MLDRRERLGALPQPFQYPTKPAKVRLLIDIPSMLRKGLLNVKKGVFENVSYALLDLRDHRGLDLSVVGDRDNSRFVISGEAETAGLQQGSP